MFFPPEVGYLDGEDHRTQAYTSLEDVSEDKAPVIWFCDASSFYESFCDTIGIVYAD